MKSAALKIVHSATEPSPAQNSKHARRAYVFTTNTQEIRNLLQGTKEGVLEKSARKTQFSASTPERAIDMALCDAYQQYATRIIMRKPGMEDTTDVYYRDASKHNAQPKKIGTLHCVV